MNTLLLPEGICGGIVSCSASDAQPRRMGNQLCGLGRHLGGYVDGRRRIRMARLPLARCRATSEVHPPRCRRL